MWIAPKFGCPVIHRFFLWCIRNGAENMYISQKGFLHTQKITESKPNIIVHDNQHLSRSMTKPTKWVCATQISLGIRPVWSESSLCAQWVAKDPSFLHADSEDSDQTRRMPRLIWVFAGRTAILLVLSCRGLLDKISNAAAANKFVFRMWVFKVRWMLMS